MCDTTGGYTDRDLDEARRAAGDLGRRAAFAPSFGEQDPARAFLYREVQNLTFRDGAGGAPSSTERPDIQRLVRHSVPTLFIVGEEDSLVPPAVIEAMHRKIPGSQFVNVPGAGHSVYWEKPGEFNRIVMEFLGRHT